MAFMVSNLVFRRPTPSYIFHGFGWLMVSLLNGTSTPTPCPKFRHLIANCQSLVSSSCGEDRSSSGINGDVQGGSLEHEKSMITCGMARFTIHMQVYKIIMALEHLETQRSISLGFVGKNAQSPSRSHT